MKRWSYFSLWTAFVLLFVVILFIFQDSPQRHPDGVIVFEWAGRIQNVDATDIREYRDVIEFRSDSVRVPQPPDTAWFDNPVVGMKQKPLENDKGQFGYVRQGVTVIPPKAYSLPRSVFYAIEERK